MTQGILVRPKLPEVTHSLFMSGFMQQACLRVCSKSDLKLKSKTGSNFVQLATAEKFHVGGPFYCSSHISEELSSHSVFRLEWLFLDTRKP